MKQSLKINKRLVESSISRERGEKEEERDYEQKKTHRIITQLNYGGNTCNASYGRAVNC